jgi:hypothetical protein
VVWSACTHVPSLHCPALPCLLSLSYAHRMICQKSTSQHQILNSKHSKSNHSSSGHAIRTHATASVSDMDISLRDKPRAFSHHAKCISHRYISPSHTLQVDRQWPASLVLATTHPRQTALQLLWRSTLEHPSGAVTKLVAGQCYCRTHRIPS